MDPFQKVSQLLFLALEDRGLQVLKPARPWPIVGKQIHTWHAAPLEAGGHGQSTRGGRPGAQEGTWSFQMELLRAAIS